MKQTGLRGFFKNLISTLPIGKFEGFPFKLRYKLARSYRKLEKNANREDGASQYHLYALEYNLKNNPEKNGIEWCKKAANNEFSPAQYDLALHYLYGNQIEQNTFLAMQWMEKAGENGYEPALKTLIRLYRSGTKVRKNLVRAQYWYARLNDSSYCETHKLPPFTEELAAPLHKEEIEKKRKITTYDNLFELADQAQVIEAEKNISFVVNAGPGTGKTYTLIHKIENLVSKQGLEAREIVLLSFTNAVVKEVKDRLAHLVRYHMGDRSLNNVTVKTFHSFAYWLLKRANENLDVLQDWAETNLSLNVLSYDDCMVKGAALMEMAPEIVEGWQYFIVDEIQDINHGKAKFVLAVLKACTKYNVPYCFLGDSCQAIYDYLDEKNSSEVKITSDEFYEALVNLSPQKTRFLSFTTNYRSNTELQNLTKPIRENILARQEYNFPYLIADYNRATQTKKFDELADFLDKNKDKKICIMERSNIATRQLSNALIKKSISHTCTLSILKGTYPHWIGKVFGGFNKKTLNYETLKELFQMAGYDKDSCALCWKKLQDFLTKKTEIVPFEQMIYALQTHDLDSLFAEQQNSNLTVSNIHRTKGLEYDYVLIDEKFLNSARKTLEEMKVLHVAITRAKTETICLTDTGLKSLMRKVDWSNRHYERKKQKDQTYRLEQIEILINNEIADVGPESFVVANMDNSQAVLKDLQPNEPIELRYEPEKNSYAIVVRGEVVGQMNDSFTKSVFILNNEKHVSKFSNLYVDGVCTYIGNRQFRTSFGEKAAKYSDKYAAHKIWNYLVFSGLALAIHD